MERYYYHGFDGYGYYESIYHMIEILKSGSLKTRNTVRQFDDPRYEHVCLYRKNDDLDYNNKDIYMRSVRSGWIDGCMVFVISNDIEAYKVRCDRMVGFEDDDTPVTNLVDEYRSVGSIPVSKIVSVALPLDDIKMVLESAVEEYKEKLESALEMLRAVTSELNITIINSNERDFTDKKDEELNRPKEAIV